MVGGVGYRNHDRLCVSVVELVDGVRNRRSKIGFQLKLHCTFVHSSRILPRIDVPY